AEQSASEPLESRSVLRYDRFERLRITGRKTRRQRVRLTCFGSGVRFHLVLVGGCRGRQASLRRGPVVVGSSAAGKLMCWTRCAGWTYRIFGAISDHCGQIRARVEKFQRLVLTGRQARLYSAALRLGIDEPMPERGVQPKTPVPI